MDNKKRIKRIKRYSAQMGILFSNAVDDILSLFKQTPKLDEGVMFSFDSLGMEKQNEVSKKLRQLHSVALLAVKHGITDEWEYADKDTDELIESVAGKVASDPNFAGWFARNEVAMDAFIGRTEAGLNLSDRIWKPVRQLRDEMEIAMTVSIGEGESASTMSRKVKQYLNDPDLMFRRFRYKIGEDAEGKPIYGKKWKKRIKDEATGTYKWIDYDKDSYKVGAGYYKSASRNAMRVTRTETNMAYRRADNQRWQSLDFVLGQSIHPNNTHDEEDICDQLAGEYPKEFIFDGWHPQCMCIAVPILVPENEMIKILKAKMKGEVYVPNVKPVKDYPEGFKEWVKDNRQNIKKWRRNGKEPYFLRNNTSIVDKIIKETDGE